MSRLPLLLALPAVACDLGGSPELADDFEDTLTTEGGCADLYVFAVDEADEVILEVRFDGVIDEATYGQAFEQDFTLPDPMIEAAVQVGEKVSDAACDDVIENGGPQIDETWQAVSGTVHLAIEIGEHTTLSDVTLEDVVFESEDGEQVTVEAFDWVDVGVGWFPG
jgi:hypothetical protein